MNEPNGPEIRVPQGETKISALSYLVSQEPPDIRSSSMPWMIGTPILLGTALSIVAYVDVMRSPALLGLLILASIVALALIWHISNSWEQTLQDTIYLVQEGRLELTTLREQLTEYLHRLNERVHKHFNALNTRKVDAHSTLIQINNALEERLNLISKLIVHGTNQSLITTYRCLQQPLEFKTSMLTDKALSRTVSVNEIERFIVELIDQIETILIAIESENEAEEITEETEEVEDSFKPV